MIQMSDIAEVTTFDRKKSGSFGIEKSYFIAVGQDRDEKNVRWVDLEVTKNGYSYGWTHLLRGNSALSEK